MKLGLVGLEEEVIQLKGRRFDGIWIRQGKVGPSSTRRVSRQEKRRQELRFMERRGWKCDYAMGWKRSEVEDEGVALPRQC